MQGTVKTVLDGINRGSISSCYLVCGDEDYLVEDAFDRIVDAILPSDQKDLNLFHMEGDNEAVDAICASLLTTPLISGRKVVAVRRTRLFHSKTSSSDLIEEIKLHLEGDPARAAKSFLSLLGIAGWSLDDLREGQWKKISDGDWRSATGDSADSDRSRWLPTVLDVCDRLKMTGPLKQKAADTLEDLLEGGIPSGNCLVMTASTVDKRKKLFKVISDTGVVISLSKPKGDSGRKGLLMDRVQETLKAQGKSITSEALLSLGNKKGLEVRDSLLELEKLIAYVGDRKTIDINDIDAVVEKTAEDSIFDLTAAIVEKNTSLALRTLYRLLDQGVNHILIITMIAREVRFLLQGHLLIESGSLSAFNPRIDYGAFQASLYPVVKAISKGKGAWLASQHPYVIYNALRNAMRFSRQELIGSIKRLADLDLAMKSSGADPGIALRRLLVEMCRRAD